MESLRPQFHQIYCADAAKALRMAQEFEAAGGPPPIRPRGIRPVTASDIAYEEVIQLASCGQVAKAKALASTQAGFQRESEIESIAGIEAKNGDIQGAEEWTQSLRSPADRLGALEGVLAGTTQERNARARAATPPPAPFL